MDDLLRWDESLYAAYFLTHSVVNAMFTPYTKGEMGQMGYGWISEKTDEGKARFFHSGNGSGFRSYVFRRPDLHLYITILVNREFPALLAKICNLEQKIEEILITSQ